MAGRRIVYAAATRENGFLPMPQADVQADLIYLCSPNNPTGAAYSRDQLQAWVDYANERGAVLLFLTRLMRASSQTGTCPTASTR